MIDKRTSIRVTILTLIMTFMEMTALPAALFCHIQVWDIEPIYFSLMINFILAFALCYVCRKTIIKEWEKDYQSMQNHFIYEERSLSFDELIKRLEELTARIRNL